MVLLRHIIFLFFSTIASCAPTFRYPPPIDALRNLRRKNLNSDTPSNEGEMLQVLFSDLSELDARIVELCDSVAPLEGEFIEFLQIAHLGSAMSAVHLANRKVAEQANAITTTITATTSADLVCYVADSLDRHIPDTVDVVIAKKVVFSSAGMDPIIVKMFQLMLSDHLDLSARLTPWLDSSQMEAGTAVVDDITQALEDGISTYGGMASYD